MTQWPSVAVVPPGEGRGGLRAHRVVRATSWASAGVECALALVTSSFVCTTLQLWGVGDTYITVEGMGQDST